MHVLVPAKSFAAAKSRLAPVMTAAARAALARAMLQDVLAAVAAARGVRRILLVSAEPEAGRLAAAAGADWLPEEPSLGMNAAVRAGAVHLSAAGQAPLLVLPADIPMLQAAEVEALAAILAAPPRRAVLVRCADGGTGALGLPPGAGPLFRFGPDSHARHRQALLAAGLAPVSLDLPGAARDIDLPADLAALEEGPAGPATRALLDGGGLRPAAAAAMPQLAAGMR